MAFINSAIAFISSLIGSIIAFISFLVPFSWSSSSSSSSEEAASSSSSSSSSSTTTATSSIPQRNYDVFLSFRGEDTRYNFTDHLYKGLLRRGIRTFRDDKLKRGEEIASELFNVIERSRFSLIVFSKNYADSRWCLNELVKIMECRKEMGQIVLSIFYHVDPSHVRKQTGSFGEAFKNYKEDTKEKKDLVQKWRTALTDAANLSGEHVKDDGYETEYIKKISEDVFRRLNHGFIHVDENLVGLDLHLKEMTSMLCIESNDVRMVGIYGCGGIGKTTLAKVVCNRMFREYEGTIFLGSVREACTQNGGLLNLQKQLLDTLVGESHNISNVDQGKLMIKNSLNSKRVLVVLDDIDGLTQLESLVGSKEWFGRGSRIIITSRNKHLLKLHHVDKSYQMKELDVEDAIELFSWRAFRQNRPKHKYADLSKCVVDYAKGLPLALKILGSLLYEKTIPEWESELRKLKRISHMEILHVLRISFDGLDREQKEIFLDIACFFKGQDKDFVSGILGGYSEIRHLSDRCLITISNDKIHMHDLIQQMGWEIVREKYPKDPNKWSRLWEPEDIYRAFTRKQGMENIEAIFMDVSKIKEIQFNSQVWAEMMKLRLLQIISSDDEEFMTNESKVHFPEDFEFPSYELSYLLWERYPLKSLPSNFDGENLVSISLTKSSIRQLWQGNKCLGKLKFLDLKKSQQLNHISNFSSMPNLERLDLRFCGSLDKIDSSISVLTKFTWLDLSNCKQLKSLPSSIQHLNSLEELYLRNCSGLEEFLEMERGGMKGLRELWLDNTAVVGLSSSIAHITSLELLSLRICQNLKSLPSDICRMESLTTLDLRDCSNLEKLPEITEEMQYLESLNLRGTGIKQIAVPLIEHLNQLQFFSLCFCQNLRSLPSNICMLKSLRTFSLNQCSNLETFPEILEDMEELYDLDLRGTAIKELPASVRRIKRLRYLDLSNCKDLETLPHSIYDLEFLEHLIAHGCSKLKKFPRNLGNNLKGFLSLEKLDLSYCKELEGAIFFNDNNQFFKLRELNISHCKLLEEITEFPSTLREIDAHDCTALETLFSPSAPLCSSLLKLLKSSTQDYSECDRDTGISKINIPGSCSGIPRWVSCQKTGNQIGIQLPMDLYEDSSFFGFAFFYLYEKVNDCSQKHFEHDFPLLYSWKLLGGSCDKEDSSFFINYDPCECYKSNDDVSERLWVVYYPKFAVLDQHDCNTQHRSLEISFKSIHATCVKIKRVGIHLVYIQDHQRNLVVQNPTSPKGHECDHNPMPLDLLRNFGDDGSIPSEDAN